MRTFIVTHHAEKCVTNGFGQIGGQCCFCCFTEAAPSSDKEEREEKHQQKEMETIKIKIV